MLAELIRLRFLKFLRSESMGRKILTGVFLALIGFFLLSNLFVAGIGLKFIIQTVFEEDDVIGFLNNHLLFFFLCESIYRFFLQKSTAVDLAHYLHLPVGRSTLIHFILLTSFVTTLNIVAILLFAPFAFMAITPEFGLTGAYSWLFTVVGISWTLHLFVTWFKQRYGDQVLVVIAAIFLIATGFNYYGILNIGSLLAPLFALSLSNLLAPVLVLALLTGSYVAVFNQFRHHAYLEELSQEKENRYLSTSFSLFDRFGSAGNVASLELRLILRHKKSRTYLGISFLFLLYGLLFYNNSLLFGEGINFLHIFIGVFITGSFIMNYGQLFLSWNSPHLDHYLSHRNGIKSLVYGKYLLICSVSLLCFILSIPYVYYGWNILAVHFATFLFNIGLNLQMVISLALWRPKAVDLNQGSMFNMEGMGAAQFLMGIPLFLFPYLVYLPFTLLFNEYVGLIVLSVAGLTGIIYYRRITRYQIDRILRNKYHIASSFRGEV